MHLIKIYQAPSSESAVLKNSLGTCPRGGHSLVVTTGANEKTKQRSAWL
jgi:hypothetical protein